MNQFRLPVLILAAAVSAAPALLAAPAIQTRSVVERVLLFPEKPDGPAMDIELELAYADGALGALIEKELYGGLDVGAYAARAVEELAGDYRENAGALLEDVGEESSTLNWYNSETVSAVRDDRSILVLGRSVEGYSGGAHGNYSMAYFVFDREKPARLGLDDFVRPERRQELSGLVMAALRSDEGLDEDASLGEAGFFDDAVEAPDNFFPAAEGLVFSWSPYEIAPYARGQVETAVDWDDLADLLTPLGKKMAPGAGRR